MAGSAAQQALAKLPYAPWYVAGRFARMPLQTNVAAALPLPDVAGWVIHWPASYSWEHSWKRLDPIRTALRQYVKIKPTEMSELGEGWLKHGGFPLDPGDHDRVGLAGNPKSVHDLRGEVIKLTAHDRLLSFAIDISDYPLVSTEILDQSDLYFKLCCPIEHPSRVVPIGWLSANSGILAVARKLSSLRASKRDIDVHGRYGTWTDQSLFRGEIVKHLQQASFTYCGGLGAMVPYPAYLNELRRSKICVDAPGQGPISYRLAEAMALGVAVVCRMPSVAFPEPLEPMRHYVPMRYDGGDVAEVCADLLDRPLRCMNIAGHAAGYFERNFTAEAIARRILRAMAQVLGAGPSPAG